MTKATLKVLFLASEAVPFAKTGGLADVAGALPRALNRAGTDVRLVLPLYRSVREGGLRLRTVLKSLDVPLGQEKLQTNVLEAGTGDAVPVYFIEREDLYERPNLYGDGHGDYYDNLERFAFFSHAALRLAENLSLRPHLIHCHDWQTGLVPALLKGPYRKSPMLASASTVFTIHNMGYQGLFPFEKLSRAGLPEEEFFHPEGLEYWGKISMLKSGIVYSEAITTVSPTYAKEIRTPECGMGMEGMLYLRRSSLFGILNGVDYRIWDPERDPHLPANYSPVKLSGKERCKESLIWELGLDPVLKGRPLMVMVTRLDIQKGIDLLLPILDDILALGAGLVILGSGDEGIEESLFRVARRYPRYMALKTGYHESLAHRIIAGADILLIPSRYEPCGLTQMYALKYGTVPVVRATGGLNDTVVPFNRSVGTGNGILFRPYESSQFLKAIRKALRLFEDRQAWKTIQANGMEADFSWDRSAKKYLELYRSILQGRGIGASRDERAFGQEKI